MTGNLGIDGDTKNVSLDIFLADFWTTGFLDFPSQNRFDSVSDYLGPLSVSLF